MKSNIFELLEQLGFSDKEAHFYVTAVKLGTFSLSSVANASGLKRPTCYVIAGNLLSKGLLSEIPSAKKQRYQTRSLSGFIQNLEEQKTLAQNAEDIITLMEAKREDANPRVEMYIGQSHIQSILKLILESGEKDFYFIGSTQQLAAVTGEGFAVYFANMIRERGVRSHIIHTDHDFDYMPTDLREVFYAPKTLAIKDGILILGHRVVVFSNEGKPYGVLFESLSLAETMRALWETVKSVSVIVTTDSYKKFV